jgi:hypothetical protein
MKKTPKRPATPKKAVSGLPDIRPGKPVEVEGLGDPFDGHYFVTPTRHTVGGGYARRSEAARVKAKAPKKSKPGKKRGLGRPRKDPGGRLFAASWLPADLLRQLDAYVAELQKAAPGASRGDVIAEALRTHRPFRLWLLKASSRALINRFGKSRLAGERHPR